MYKMILSVEGMACGMCEAHVNDAIRRAFPVKKVTSSHSKGRTEILVEEPLEEELLRRTVAETGYRVTEIRCETVEKKGLFGRGKRR